MATYACSLDNTSMQNLEWIAMSNTKHYNLYTYHLHDSPN